MALALYRKYRPATFGEVAGQEHVTEPLRTALASGRINHAYLFSGPRGCGKTSSARILARSLNCAQGPTADPCGECDSCLALAPEGAGSVDVVELDAASHGGVDDTRELRDRAFFAPAQSRYRIFVIDEAHMVTTQGFNALLKIVEEPPEHLIFVFATTEPDKVLTTIRSRTHHYPFRLMPPGVMRELLDRICGDEGVQVEAAVHPLVIRAGGGSARDTLSILDQLLAGADSRGVTYERAVALLGVTDVALIDDMLDGLAADDGAAVYGTIDRVVEAGHDPRRFASDLLDRLRDLILLRSVPDAAERGLVQSAGDELTKMRGQADQLGAATLSRFAEIVHSGLSEMRGATAPRLLLELLCARMLLPAVADSETALVQRLERVERRMTIAPPSEPTAPAPEARDAEPPAPTTPAPATPKATAVPKAGVSEAASPKPAEPETAAPAPPDPVVAEGRSEPTAPVSGMDAAGIRRVWTELLRAVAERNRPTQALLLNATVQDLRDGALVLSMPTSGLVKQLAQQHRLEFVRDAMRAVIGGEWEVRCVEAGQAPAAASRPPATSSPPAAPAEGPASRSGGAAADSRDQARQPERASRDAPGNGRPAREQRSAAGARPAPEAPPPPEEPPPPEPPEDPDEAVEDLWEDSAPVSGEVPRRDSQEAAVDLLASELGARRIDD